MVPDCLVYVDYLSHQVYGESGPPAFVETRQSSVKWTDWVGAKARFVPSLTRPQHENGDYERTREHFRKLGIEATGYVLWPTASASAARRCQQQLWDWRMLLLRSGYCGRELLWQPPAELPSGGLVCGVAVQLRGVWRALLPQDANANAGKEGALHVQG